jgi:hypothetical protein
MILSLLNELEDIISKNISIVLKLKKSNYSFPDFQHTQGLESGHLHEPGSKSNSRDDSHVYHLSELLYRIYHCRYTPYQANQYDSLLQTEDYVNNLSAANSGTGTWDPGWRIENMLKNGQIKVSKNGLNLWARPEQFFSYDHIYEVGKLGYIRIGKEMRGLMPGFYCALGNKAESTAEHNDDLTIVRLYWNIIPGGAVLLMKYLTRELNRIEVPFRFKILNNPINFSRTDAAVLYIHEDYFRECLYSLPIIYQQVKNYLNPSVSIFTKRIAPGLGLAEELKKPEKTEEIESFGQNRCRILAESFCYAFSKGNNNNSSSSEVDFSTKKKIMIAYMKKSGMDVAHPYLNADSTDRYGILIQKVEESYRVEQ